MPSGRGWQEKTWFCSYLCLIKERRALRVARACVSRDGGQNPRVLYVKTREIIQLYSALRTHIERRSRRKKKRRRKRRRGKKKKWRKRRRKKKRKKTGKGGEGRGRGGQRGGGGRGDTDQMLWHTT